MFNFLFQDKNDGLQSLAETITIELEKLNIAKLAVEKAETMIAKAIAKSDILIQTQSENKRKYEYRLNVQPNDNENGTYFWTKVVKKLLREGEAVIIRIGEKYYRVQSFQESDNVMTGRLYSNITVEAAEKQYSLLKTFLSGDVIHLRYDNSKIRVLLNSMLLQYETTANSVNAMMQIANTPKFIATTVETIKKTFFMISDFSIKSLLPTALIGCNAIVAGTDIIVSAHIT